MIKIDKLNYSIDNRKLFNDSNIVVNEGELTVVYGESGSGKSTLLNILAFNIEADYSYSFNNIDITNLNQKEKINFRRDNIVYIHQDDTLISNYSLKDNARLIIEAKGQIFDENKLLELMKVVGIAQKKLNKPISNLSNGQRQRFAIICSMMVEAWLYIYDEPTSSMDKENALKVVELLKTFVSPEKMIVVSLHDRELITDSHTYLIENNSINEIISGNQLDNINYKLNNSKTNKKLLQKEGITKFLTTPIINAISIITLATVIVIASLFFSYGNQLLVAQTDTLNNVYDKELFIVKGTTGYDDYTYLPIDLNVIDAIKNIDGVNNVYPHYSLITDDYVMRNDGIGIEFLDERANVIYVKNNDEIVQSINKSDIFQSNIEIESVYPHQQIVDRCEYYSEGDGIYISSYLAQLLNITSDNASTRQLTIPVTIPIAAIPGVSTHNNIEELCRGPVLVYQELTYPIKGILKRTTMNYYSLQEPHIFLDYEVIENLIEETTSKNANLISILATQETTNTSLASLYPYNLLNDSWIPSAYVIEANSLTMVDQIKSEIQKIDPTLTVRGMQVNGQMAQDLVSQQKTLVLIITSLLLVVIVILTIVIKYFKKKNSKTYIKYLQNIGLYNEDINRIMIFENCLVTLFLLLVSVIYSIMGMILLKGSVVIGLNYTIALAVLIIVTNLLSTIKVRD